MPHTVLTPESTYLFDDFSLPIMVLDRDFRFVYVNKAYLKIVHSDAEELMGRYVFDAFPESEDRIESVLEPWRRTLAGEITTLEALPFKIEMDDGTFEERVWEATQEPLRNLDGEIVGLIQRTQDITEQNRLTQRNLAIAHELSHRVKNIMAVVSSVARITGRNATDVKDFVASFTARVSAMSRTNDLLSLGNWNGLEVDSILRDELSPYGEVDAPESFKLTGPKVRLDIDASKDLSMVVHELATNAAKYGCLGENAGTLDISWTRTADRLTILWRESCAREIVPPTSVGFGTRLFDMLPYITVERDFTPSGLHLTITMDGEKVFA
ncbi:MAG: HWE histidine kinase domain-containing protein [Litorimonas sp.]